MTLTVRCKNCKQQTIARRIMGYYVGSQDKFKCWECRECGFLWRNTK